MPVPWLLEIEEGAVHNCEASDYCSREIRGSLTLHLNGLEVNAPVKIWLAKPAGACWEMRAFGPEYSNLQPLLVISVEKLAGCPFCSKPLE